MPEKPVDWLRKYVSITCGRSKFEKADSTLVHWALSHQTRGNLIIVQKLMDLFGRTGSCRLRFVDFPSFSVVIVVRERLRFEWGCLVVETSLRISGRATLFFEMPHRGMTPKVFCHIYAQVPKFRFDKCSFASVEPWRQQISTAANFDI